jgi:hypothetical protein
MIIKSSKYADVDAFLSSLIFIAGSAFHPVLQLWDTKACKPCHLDRLIQYGGMCMGLHLLLSNYTGAVVSLHILKMD